MKSEQSRCCAHARRYPLAAWLADLRYVGSVLPQLLCGHGHRPRAQDLCGPVSRRMHAWQHMPPVCLQTALAGDSQQGPLAAAGIALPAAVSTVLWTAVLRCDEL